MAKQQVKAGGAYVEIGIRDKVTSQLKAIGNAFNAFGQKLNAIGRSVSIAGAAMNAPLAAGVAVFTSLGDSIAKMSDRTGVSVEALSELRHAATQSGASVEELENGLRLMQRALTEAAVRGGSVAENFQRLGVNVKALAALNPEQQFTAVADAISRVEDPTERAAFAMQLLGRSGTKLLPLINGGAAGIEALRKEARDLGLTISTDSANAAVVLGDQFANVKDTLIAVSYSIGNALAPALSQITKIIQTIATAVTKFIQRNQHLVRIFAVVTLGVSALGAALVVLGTTSILVGAIFSGLATIFAATATALTAVWAALTVTLSPLAIVAISASAAGAAFLVFSGIAGRVADNIKNALGGMAKFVGETMDAIVAALTNNNIELASKIFWSSLELVWLKGVKRLAEIWDGLLTSIGLEGLQGGIGLLNFAIKAQTAQLTADRLAAQRARQDAEYAPKAAAFGGAIPALAATSAGTFSAAAATRIGQSGLETQAQRAQVQAANDLQVIRRKVERANGALGVGI